MSAEQPPRVDTQIARPSQNTLFQSPTTLDTVTIRPASILISPTDSSKRNSRRPPSRVIRTFEEKHVTTTVSAEEWYEELECGVCAHVLGAPQVLVPCGHSLCGPCAWEWIKKNKNLTCPHCRHQLHEAMPFVPNIVVDQIIERKLQSLPETPAKVDIMVERKDKAEAWKLVQAALKPPVPRRRNFDDTVFGLFGVDNNAHRQSQHQRRASRHLPELGPPVPSQSQPRPAPQSARRPTHPYGTGMNLAEIRRHEVEEQNLPSRAEIRRLREASIRDQQAHQLAMRILEEEVAAPPESERPPVSIDSRLSPPAPTVPYRANAAQRRERTNSGTPIGPRPPNSRAPGSRSRVLADRQARGRGSRETPLVVLTDSE